MTEVQIPKEFIYLAKLYKSNGERTKYAWCNLVDNKTGNRDKIMEKFIDLEILEENGVTKNKDRTFIVNKKEIENYVVVSDLGDFIINNLKMFKRFNLERG